MTKREWLPLATAFATFTLLAVGFVVWLKANDLVIIISPRFPPSFGPSTKPHILEEFFPSDTGHPFVTPYLPEVLREGEEAPTFSLIDLEGEEHDLRAYRGNVVLLAFLEPKSLTELQALHVIYEKYKDRGLVVLAVSVEGVSTEEGELIKKMGYTFPVLMDATNKVFSLYRPPTIPAWFLINKEGRIVRIFLAPSLFTNRREVVKEIETFLGNR
jgi:peroxiredoxin